MSNSESSNRKLAKRTSVAAPADLRSQSGRLASTARVGSVPLLALAMAAAALLAGAAPLVAQQELTEEEKNRANANNPLADITGFNIQNYWIPTLYGVDDEQANTFWLRFVQPTGPVLWRLSVPLPTVPTGGDPEAGLGDTQLFAAYLAVKKPTFTFGVGPQFVFPTASKDVLGTGKWQAGLAAVVFAIPDPRFQVGSLVLWQHSFAGDEDRETAHALAYQPFAIWQLGGGTYLRTAPIWFFNLETGDYHIPFGFGIGHVVRLGQTVFNIFIEPQYTILHEGAGQPAFQLYTALNMQFIKKKKE